MPYRLVGTVRFYDRREIRDLMAYLKLIANPADDEAFRRAVGVPKRGLGETDRPTPKSRVSTVDVRGCAAMPRSSPALRPAARIALAGFRPFDRRPARRGRRRSTSCCASWSTRSAMATTCAPRSGRGRLDNIRGS
jgi:hypothetical protein